MPKHRRKVQPIDVNEWAGDASLQGIESLLASRLSSPSLPSEAAPDHEQEPKGDSPMGTSPMSDLPITIKPMGASPMGASLLYVSPGPQQPQEPQPADSPVGVSPMGYSPMGQSPTPQSPMGRSTIDVSRLPGKAAAESSLPMGELPMGVRLPPAEGQMVVVPGQGLRKLYRCTNGHHGHSAAEDALWMFMLWVGRGGRNPDPQKESNSYDIDLSLSAMVKARRSDHKQIQKLLRSLRAKRAIDLLREPDVRRAIPARYRVYSERALYRLRQQAGMRWMVKTAAVLLIDDQTASQWLSNSPIGYQPMGESPLGEVDFMPEPMGRSPMGPTPEVTPLAPTGPDPNSPMGRKPMNVNTSVSVALAPPTTTFDTPPATLAQDLHSILGPFTGDFPDLLWKRGREVVTDLTGPELLHIVALMAPKATKGSPTGFVLSLLQSFLRGPSLNAYREEQGRAETARRLAEQRELEFWQDVLHNPGSDEETRAYARDFLDSRTSQSS